jgi:hypothetical protein
MIIIRDAMSSCVL